MHKTPLIYWPAGNDHACQDADCEHAHGFKAVELPPVEVEITADTTRFSRALLDTQAILMFRHHPDLGNLGRNE
ncbi:hypothetical protein [Streptomyces pini]|uniref:hypothetical protein n=1 Tax=Streptomyces pini TaxID=1520580 RepID=UPI000B81FF57|nr:hypothetical protein [Streptomyces pini]